MKTIEQIEDEVIGDVMTADEFFEGVDCGCLTSYDGWGYFHDGESETDKNVWDDSLTWDDVCDYPYVVWYNK